MPTAPTALKHDYNKTRWDLLPFEALEEVAAVLTYGAGKYSEQNWRWGFKFHRPLAAALRHITAWARGEDTDEESGYSHLSHAVCCLLFLISFQKTGSGVDDRVFVFPAAEAVKPAQTQETLWEDVESCEACS